MRLSTEPNRDQDAAIAVLHAAFDAGITFLDTADAYCLDHTETGHNERLIARARDSWAGDRSRILIATKGGLTRPHGGWVADGRARHLEAACEASRRALGVDRIHLYQLHAPDPRTPLATSVRALAALKREGVVEHIGLCNVNVGQIEEARGITGIASVQVELSVWNDDNLLNGVAAYCVANDIALIAYRPLGGLARRRRTVSNRVLASIAESHAATPFEAALAWLRDLSPAIVPIPGATRPDTVASIARARELLLSDDDRARLEEEFPSARLLRVRRPARSAADGEIVLIMGLPDAGKSTVAETLASQGYQRLNRDEAGGALRDLLPSIDRAVASGKSRIVLDNTYVSRKSRGAVVQAASKHGLPVRCVWLSTSVEDAQVNAAWRMVSKYGRVLDPDEMRKAAARDVNTYGPAVQFRYQRELEPPHATEGFSRIDIVPFERTRDDAFTNRALILWCENVLYRSRSGARTPSAPEDVDVFAERGEILRRYDGDGWRLLGLSWQPQIADDENLRDPVIAGFARMQELLGVSIDVLYCPHAAGPPVCWCRKPLPGLGVMFIQRHRLDPSRCIYVGDGPQDPGFARRLGFQYQDAGRFFGSPEK